jgi:adenosylhomocysteinase
MTDHGGDQLADRGRELIEWAGFRMPVVKQIRERFGKEKPLAGITVGACLHVTAETGNLLLALRDGGARVFASASNPLSTQDQVAVYLSEKEENIAVYAFRGEDDKTYVDYLGRVLEQKPDLVIDDGADLITALHEEGGETLGKVIGGAEETTTGINRLTAMSKEGALKIPVISVNDADTKHLFDNRYGTGQSTIDGILRATNILLAGKRFVVAGYGWCGRGIAARARGMGARVIVTEIDPIRALEAVMDGFAVMSMDEAAEVGEVFVTATGAPGVITVEQMRRMPEGAIVANAGHFNVEADYAGLVKAAPKERTIRSGLVEEFRLDGKSLYVIGQGRLVNLVAAEGHPAEVMDLSFANQALAMEYLVRGDKTGGRRVKLKPGLHRLPRDIDEQVARLKLEVMGISVGDRLRE